MEQDRFGIVDETTFSLRYPRMVDESAPTLESALREAMSYLTDYDSKKIAIVTTRYRNGTPYEDKLLMELYATDFLTKFLDEEDALLPSTTAAHNDTLDRSAP